MPTFGVISVPPRPTFSLVKQSLVPSLNLQKKDNPPNRIPRSQSDPLRNRTVLFLRFRELLLRAEGFMGLDVLLPSIRQLFDIHPLYAASVEVHPFSYSIERRIKGGGSLPAFCKRPVSCVVVVVVLSWWKEV